MLNELIQEVYSRGNENYPSILLTILKEKHLFPSIKIKKFKDDKNLCLLHNSYKCNDVPNEYKELYDECRSIVLDFSKSVGNNVVINCANSIPIRMTIDNYISNIKETDKYYIALDGTLITCYYHNGKWFFGSSCCSDINSSKFSHPTKTHGYMLDEVLYEMYKNNVDINDPNISITLRNLLTSNLSPLYSYEFILIHYENKHIIDYTNELGNQYKYLFHINTRNRLSLQEENIENKPLEYLGIKYSLKFNTSTDAINYLYTNNNSIIVKRDGKLIKLCNDLLLHKEEVNANNYNIWYNLIYVYMLQKPNYNINEYLMEFCGGLNEFERNPYDEIHLIFMTITEVLYNLYVATTNYYPKYKRFKINLDMDKTFNPLIRFHLAQLRYKQTSVYTNAILRKEEIYNYLCHSNNIKNIGKIIYHISTSSIYNIPNEIIEVFKKINTNLG